ncbi:MAG: hypothetical protein ACD_21C00171G0002 [uncultured bacterium]|nr:MAG: hypothetical protein ACD_21C00171G0002 [uncultured bacterium]
MKKIKNIGIILSFFVFGQALAGLEVENALWQINNSVAFGLVGFNLDYKESFLSSDARAGVMPKSTESGTILGLFFDVRKAFAETIYTDFYLDYYDGKLKYDGSERNTYAPLTANLWHRFFNADAKAGYIFTFTEDSVLQLIPYAGVGYRYWYRQYNNVGEGGKEKYKNYKVVGGIKLNWLLTDEFIISPYFEGGKTFGANMKYCGSGTGNGYNYTLGNKPIYEAGLEANWRMFDEFFLNGFANYTQFKYGRSAPQAGSFEPDSKTREIKFGLGVRYSWLVN